MSGTYENGNDSSIESTEGLKGCSRGHVSNIQISTWMISWLVWCLRFRCEVSIHLDSNKHWHVHWNKWTCHHAQGFSEGLGCSFETFKLECILRQFWRNKYTSSCQATWCYDRFCPWLGIYGEAWEWCECTFRNPEMSDSGGTTWHLCWSEKPRHALEWYMAEPRTENSHENSRLNGSNDTEKIQLGMEC